jgi:hypothetical protein
MASRKEKKEQLRRERERREAEAKAAERRKRMIGYGVGGAIVAAAAVVLLIVVVAGGGSDAGGSSGDGFYGDDGSVPEQKITDLNEAVKAAGCELKNVPGRSREHTGDLAENIEYSTNPPSSGKHYEVPAEDQAYGTAPDAKELVHTLEHGRVIVWFKKNLPAEQRDNLKALYDEDEYQMVLTPNETGMKYAVAATAWNAEPVPNGTGRLLGCPKFNDRVYDALRTFKDEHRSNGPEAVP